MKKIGAILTLFFLLIPLYGTTDLSLKFSAGLKLIDLMEINDLLKSWLTFYQLEAESRVNFQFLSGEAQSFGSLVDLEGELLFSLSDRFGISLGSGMIFGEIPQVHTEARVQKVVGEFIYVHPVQISAVPLFFSGYAKINIIKSLSLFAKGGIGIIWAQFIARDGRRLTDNIKFTYNKVIKAKAGSPALQTGLGISYQMDSGLQFFLEGTYRHSKIKGFSGKNENEGSGDLYSYEEYIQNLDFWKKQYSILAKIPSGDLIRSAKEVVIDLSGFSFKIGLIVKF